MASDKLPESVHQYFTEHVLPTEEDSDLGTDWLGEVVRAMSEASSLTVVSKLLKELKVRSSAGSWSALKKDRLRPALERGLLKRDQLLGMLQEMEEYSSQHILLYQLKPSFSVEKNLNPVRVKRALSRQGCPSVYEALPGPETPRVPVLTHVRIEGGTLVYKELELKTTRRRIQSFEVGRDFGLNIERLITVRRARIARLHPSGLLEVRLGAYQGTRFERGYDADAQSFLSRYRWLVEPTQYEIANLAVFKDAIWKSSKRHPHIQIIRQNVNTDRGSGVSFSAKTRKANAAADPSVRLTRRTLLNESGSSHGSAEVRWKSPAGVTPAGADVVVRVTERPNEFFIARSITKAEYDYVFNDIVRLGKL